MAGVARDLAQLLVQVDQGDQALRVLAKGAKAGCHEDGRRLCRHYGLQLKVNLAFEKGDYAQAISCMTKLLDDDDKTPRLVRDLVAVYTKQAEQAGGDPGLDQLRSSVAAWQERARQYIASFQETQSDEQCVISEEDLASVDRILQTGIMTIQLTSAVATFNRGVERAQDGSVAEAKKALESSRELATQVLDDSSEDEPDHDRLRSQATDILEGIEKVLAQI